MKMELGDENKQITRRQSNIFNRISAYDASSILNILIYINNLFARIPRITPDSNEEQYAHFEVMLNLLFAIEYPEFETPKSNT